MTNLPPEPLPLEGEINTSQSKKSPHKRLTADQVKKNWLLGDYTASGYLFHLIGALRKDGWSLDIPNVAEFCWEWEIGERRFYRAKAKLIEQGRLGERIKGRLQLWLISSNIVPLDGTQGEDFDEIFTDSIVSPTDTAVIPTDNTVSPTDTAVITTDAAVSDIGSKSPSSKRSQDSPDLLQIFYNFYSSLSQAHPPDTQEREKFENFCRKKVEELPKRPTLPDRWIGANLSELWQQYQKESSGASALGIDWEQHPQAAEYLAALKAQGKAWIGTCYDPEEKQKRLDYWQWAKRRGLIGGRDG